MGNAGGDVVLLVGQRDLIGAHLVHQLGMGLDVSAQIGGVIGPREHAHRHGGRIGDFTAALHAFPAQLQEDPVLRIHQLGFARTDAEEGGIELLHSLDDSARGHVGRMHAIGQRNGRIKLVLRKGGDRIAPGTQVVPERFHIGRAWEAPGHRNDGHRLVGRSRLRGGLGRIATRTGEAALANVRLSALHQRSGKRGRRRVGVDQRGRQWLFRMLLQSTKQLHGQHRIATQVEKVVVPPGALDAEKGRERLAYLLLA